MNALIRHWELKLLALGFAFALWLFVMTSERSDLLVSTPVELAGVPAGLSVLDGSPETVDVQLHGLRGNLARLDPDQVRARLDLSGANAGEVVLKIKPEHVTAPSGVTVVRVYPSRVRVVLGTVPPSGGDQARRPRS